MFSFSGDSMFQFQNSQKDVAAVAEPFVAFWRDVARQSQESFQKAAAEAGRLAREDAERAQSLARVKDPQEACALLSQAAQERQAYVAQKSKSVWEDACAYGAQLRELMREQAERAAFQASGALEAAVVQAKNGLDLGLSGAQSAIEKTAQASFAPTK
jgi:hypothetical protein